MAYQGVIIHSPVYHFLSFIIIIKRLCYHAICQMNAIAVAMQAMNRRRMFQSGSIISMNMIILFI